jgi:hypothetical protein
MKPFTIIDYENWPKNHLSIYRDDSVTMCGQRLLSTLYTVIKKPNKPTCKVCKLREEKLLRSK